MNDQAKRRADELTEKAISEASHEDFRVAYRDRLRWLKDKDAAAFANALAYYNDILVTNIANGGDPIREWIEYGRQLGDLSGKGQVLRIDDTGRAHPETAEQPSNRATEQPNGLILHLPDDTNVPALPLAIPRAPSEAQKATLQLLVRQPRGDEEMRG